METDFEEHIAVATIVLFDGVTELTVGRVVGVAIDLALIEVLSRLHLRALRAGCRIRVRAPAQALRELLILVGLGELVELPIDGLAEARQPSVAGNPKASNSSG